MDILVYTDEDVGASSRCVAMTIASLKNTVSSANTPHTVRATTSQELVGSKWRNSCCLLVMPGGRDLPYCKALNGQGNKEIREFVSEGGSYLGICAGAYYGSAKIEFARGDPNLEVTGLRDLAFFPGVTARGPVYPGFTYTTSGGARAAPLRLTERGKQRISPDKDNTTLFIYYNGGCEFIQDGDVTTPYDVMATYTQLDGVGTSGPAIIGGGVGKGRVILSGLHIEASYKLLNEQYGPDEDLATVLETMETTEQERRHLFDGCISYLLHIL